jgi:hypothetical protein
MPVLFDFPVHLRTPQMEWERESFKRKKRKRKPSHSGCVGAKGNGINIC